MVALQASIEAGVTSVSYRYPDDQESYALDQPLRNLGAHLTEQIRTLAQQGIRLDRLELVTELQEDRGTLDYAPGQLYNGDFGGTLPTYTLTDNESGQSEEKALSIGANAQVTLEGLAVLKLTALRKYLLDQGIPAEAITLTLQYNHSANTYREETRAVLKLRG